MTVFIFPLNPAENKVRNYYTNVGFCKYLFWKKCIFLKNLLNPLKKQGTESLSPRRG